MKSTLQIILQTRSGKDIALRKSLTNRLQRGFSIVSAIFLLVVLASLGAAIVSISTTQSMNSMQDLQGSRAYHAARAGIEWGIFQVMNPAAVVPTAAPACPAGTTLIIEGFSVVVTCVISVPTYHEGVSNGAPLRTIAVYQLTSKATSGSAIGAVDYVERQLQVTFSKCVSTESGAPALCS